jgi:uroporphyrinogen-III synthase
MSQTPVLLLKTPADDLEQDPHYIELSGRGYLPVFVPVLETAFANQARLREIIASGPNTQYSGVTVTSRRAADAWRDAALGLTEGQARCMTKDVVLVQQQGKAPGLKLHSMPWEK